MTCFLSRRCHLGLYSRLLPLRGGGKNHKIQKTISGAWIRHFKTPNKLMLKLAYNRNYCIDSSQILHSNKVKNTKCCSSVVQTCITDPKCDRDHVPFSDEWSFIGWCAYSTTCVRDALYMVTYIRGIEIYPFPLRQLSLASPAKSSTCLNWLEVKAEISPLLGGR